MLGKVSTPSAQLSLDMLDWQESVIDKDISDPTPLTPSLDDRYIVAAPGAGAWTGHDNEIARWDGTTWDFIPPDEGFCCFVEDEDTLYIWNGTAWVIFSKIGSFLTVLTPGDDLKAALEGASTGQHFYLKAGDYTVASTISLGVSGVILDGSRNAIVTYTGAGGTNSLNFTTPGSANASLRNFRLVCTGNTNGVSIGLRQNLYCDNVWFQGGGIGTALLVGNNTLHVVIKGCVFNTWESVTQGATTTNSHIWFDHCWFNGADINQSANPLINITCIGCVFGDAFVKSTSASSESVNIIGCTFDAMTSIAIELNGSRNVIANNQIVMAAAVQAMSLDGNAVVQGNTIYALDDGIYVNVSKGMVITDNVIYSDGASGRGVEIFSGHATIKGNTLIFTGTSAETGLQLDADTEDCVIEGNIFDAVNLPGAVTTKAAIKVLTGSARDKIIGNSIINPDAGGGFEKGIQIDTNSVAEGNTLYQCPGQNGGIGIDVNASNVQVIGNSLRSINNNVDMVNTSGDTVTVKGNHINVTGTGAEGIVTGADERLLIEGNQITADGLTALNVDAGVTYTIVKNNIYTGSATLPTGGTGNIVADNVDAG